MVRIVILTRDVNSRYIIVMKKMSDKNEPVTKGDLKIFATKDDLKRFATKDDLRVEIGLVKIDFQEAFENHDEKNREYRDQVLTGLDKVMKELEAIREDSVVGTHQTREIRVDVDNHEKRIAKLEAAN